MDTPSEFTLRFYYMHILRFWLYPNCLFYYAKSMKTDVLYTCRGSKKFLHYLAFTFELWASAWQLISAIGVKHLWLYKLLVGGDAHRIYWRR